MILHTLNIVSDGYVPGSNLGIISNGYLYAVDFLWKPKPEKPRRGSVGGSLGTYKELEEAFQASEIVVDEIQVGQIDFDLDIPDIDNDLNDLDFDI